MSKIDEWEKKKKNQQQKGVMALPKPTRCDAYIF